MSEGKISREEVLRVARLARLELSEDEVQALQKDMEKILGYVEVINEAGADELDPTFSTMEKSTPMRDDKPDRKFNREEILKNAPERRENFFVVPKVIE